MLLSCLLPAALSTLMILGLFPFYVAVGASASEYWFNTSSSGSPLAPLWSTRDLSVSPFAPDSFDKRQTGVCSAGPGGPVCSPTTCCAAGRRCCPTGCCPVSSNCFGVRKCCPIGDTICPGETACCLPGSACCGSGCCSPGNICERNNCIDRALRDKIIRLKVSKQNDEILKNMCEAMLNTLNSLNETVATLTYRGPDLDAISRARAAAGCNDGYCADQIARGLVPSTYTSCVEYPPASTMEGGTASLASRRSFSCVPERQSLYQGGTFSWTLNSDGIGLQFGDEFVISIDCESVSIGLPASGETLDASGPDTVSEHESAEELGVVLAARDEESVSKSGNEAVDPDVLNDNQPELNFLIAPFGDLKPGTYTAKIQVVTGSTVGGTVLDNEGMNYANNTSLQSGQSHEYPFTLKYWTPGMGILMSTSDRATRVNWTLEGTVAPPVTSTSSSRGGTTQTGTGNSPASTGISGVKGPRLHAQFFWNLVLSSFLYGFL